MSMYNVFLILFGQPGSRGPAGRHFPPRERDTSVATRDQIQAAVAVRHPRPKTKASSYRNLGEEEEEEEEDRAWARRASGD